MSFDKPKTKAMADFLRKEAHRVTGLSIEGDDGVFIYTTSAEWCDDAGSGTFHGSSETAAIKAFYDRVRKADGNDAAADNNFLAAIERCKVRGDNETAKRIDIERRMVSAIVRHALANDMTISVFDGCEWTLEQSSNYDAIFAALFTTDMDNIALYDRDGKHHGTFALIYGNDGWDVVQDYTITPVTDRIWNEIVEPLADKLEASSR